MEWLWIALGSALGGMSRHWVSSLVTQMEITTLPLGTLVVNVSGSFLIGLVATYALGDSRILLAGSARTFLMIGFFGGFTTFSTFSLQTLNLLQERQVAEAFLNIIASVVLCLIAVALGYGLGRLINTGS